MTNEIVLLLSLLLSFGGLLAFFRLGGKAGIYGWTVFVTITANIEVLALVHAFGMDQTLGNTLFAASFTATDILSEEYGRKASNRAVRIGIAADVCFILLSLTWMRYRPAADDQALPYLQKLFASTPRVMGASLAAYVVSQFHDVWSYHFWWGLTTRLGGDEKKYLWVRNNCSTLISQLINTALFTFLAFSGTYRFPTLLSILFSSYVVFIFTSLLDTPFVYLARWMYHRFMVPSGGAVARVDQD